MLENPLEPAPRGVVGCAAYRAGRRVPETGSPERARAEVAESGGFAWVGLFEPSAADLARVVAVFGLPVMAVDHALAGRRRPRLERFGHVVVVVLKTVRHADFATVAEGEIVETGDVVVVVGADVVVTIRHRVGIGRVRAGLEAAPERLALGPAAVLQAVVEHVVADQLAATDAFTHQVDQVEDLVFAPRRPVGPERVQLMKREVTDLHRSITPLAATLRLLLGDDTPEPAEVDTSLRILAADIDILGERIASLDEVLTTLLAVTLAKVGLRQNEDTRRLGAWIAILSVPTAVAGTYGMNFVHMPELTWHAGRPVILGITVVVCLLLHRAFRRNRWL